MAKYCVKCGKTLPDGVEVCPDCNITAESEEKEAALFTHMSPTAEVWKTAEPVKDRRKAKKPRNARRTAFFYAAAAVLVVAAVVLVVFGQPASRIARALHRGEIDSALQIYRNTPRLSGSEERSETVDKAIMAAAQSICAQYANHTMDADTAATKLAQLGSFGEASAAMLADTYAQFRESSTSQTHMESADRLYEAGQYLEARAEYLQVLISDGNYASAQEQAAQCLIRYGESVAEAAEQRMQENDYPGAITLLQDGNDILSNRYRSFSDAIDELLPQCYDRYEQYLLTEAQNLAALEDYEAAVKKISASLSDFPAERAQLTDALAVYTQDARAKRLKNAGERADADYDAGKYAEAFASLESFKELPDEDAVGAAELIRTMEKRFAQDKCAEAESIFAGERGNLEKAIAVLNDAYAVRPLEDIRTYCTNLEAYLPLFLAEAEYASKDGVVFRSRGDFVGLNGKTYSDGWIWGANESEITFILDGAYDLFECKFVTRRDDEEEAEGQFEVWCDGEKVFTSELLVHPQVDGQTVVVDVSGCKELRIVFLCDYEVSTTENGYCYHGVCNPTLTKAIDDIKAE